ncbi:MAG: pseudouridine-5'-phosphate glycosidase [Firmicutes bacterium]|nr:pseudouridine-5'-phosphate glycosidase [Bacillota bacterium]
MLMISDEVRKAIESNQPVVALESTIISHGMPYPKNIETALRCEEIIRENGAIPATIAIIDGIIKVGLSKSEIEAIAKPDATVMKVSRRDLPLALSKKKNGALTVAATMIASQLAGIRFFATGGIGGVHRHGETTMDISADLEELKTTSVCVVSAGVKSILDIGKTLEYLETLGVPVIGFGVTEMPAFYTRDSDFDVPISLSSFEEVASFLKAKWDLPLPGGVLIANPIPKEFSYDKQAIDAAIEQALIECDAYSIKGKEITPYLLKRITEITEGASLVANMELVFNNAYVAANIAKIYFKENFPYETE